MTTSEKKKILYGIFGIMVSKGIMNNQHDMTSRLKGVLKSLKTIHGLTDQECDECLLYFFREYAQGCSVPIDDVMIKTQFVPIVKNYPHLSKDDILWGASMIVACNK